jgi:metallophosphoesterase (TIGR03767 family)
VGWPIEVRGDLAEPKSGREDRREALASIVHLTDIHVIDAQSPARVEFLDRDSNPPQDPIPFSSAWRAQETLCGHIADAMIQRVNAIGRGPVTGRPFDCAVSTGDNTDNQQKNELDWFMALLDGQPLAANSGDPTRYEGVQDTDTLSYDEHYWHPDEVAHPITSEPDQYKRFYGFPSYPGLLEAAIVPFTATGLRCPWYSTYGNHDGLLQGNAPTNPVFEGIATGSVKVTSRPAGFTSADFMNGLINQDPAVLAAFATAPGRPVTADPERTIIPPSAYVQAHLDSTTSPNGHGYTDENVETEILYFTFDITDDVMGISLDTVNRGGYADGSLDRSQVDWLEEQLAAVHSRHFDGAGTEVTTGNDDRLVVLFSHHNLGTMDNPVPAGPDDERVMSAEVEALIHRFPNVVLWVNGHSHVNRVWARPDTSGRTGGFWEVNTAAHIDAPQHARLVEIVDNMDGTLSIFGTLIDHDAPAAVAYDARDPMALASLSRELSWNDPQAGLPSALGAPGDRNVELVLTRPFAPVVGGGPPGGGATPAPVPPPAPAPTPALPATGGGAGLLAGAAAIGAAAVLARRDRPPGEDTR